MSQDTQGLENTGLNSLFGDDNNTNVTNAAL